MGGTLEEAAKNVNARRRDPVRVAVVVSHVIQYYAPWYREIARAPGVELRVFFCRNWGAENYFDQGFGSDVQWNRPLLEGYDYEFLPVRGDGAKRGFWAMDCPSVAGILGRFNPDVVLVFGYGIRLNWRVATWAKRNRKPLMVFSDSNYSAPRAFWKRIAKEFVVGLFYRHVDGAFCVGDSNRAYHRHYGVPEERLFEGAFPIDCQNLLQAARDRDATRQEIRASYGIPANAFVVNVSAKYIPLKRHIDVLAAVHALEREGKPVWALLVGEGPERPALEEFCRTNSMKNAVLTGFVNQSGIGAYYAASDVVMLASSSEAYGVAVAEGMVFGLPVIVSDRCGCIGQHDIAQPGVNALVYPCGDYTAAKSAIEKLLNDSVLYWRMSAESLRIVERRDVRYLAQEFAEGLEKMRSLGPRSMRTSS